MKGKPIEPGCKALVVNALHPPSNSGKVVTVLGPAPVGYLPPPFRYDGTKPGPYDGKQGPLWVVHREQGDLKVCAVLLLGGMSEHLTDERTFGQKCLIRLDDPEFTENTHEQLETHR